MTREELQACYRQTLVWRAQGLSIDEIGRHHTMTFVVALRHFYDALQWDRTAPVLTADFPLEALHCSTRSGCSAACRSGRRSER